MTRRTGYSLLEVLIAFVILTLVLAALLPGQARLLGRATVQEQQLLAHDYALSQVAAIGTSTPPDIGTTENTYRNWDITTTIAPSESLGDPTTFIAIEVRVHNSRSQLLATAHSVMVSR
ncbi:hypothetical protein DS901_02505 [Loktanella sp. D2R18]|uniref:type IV pilus modification PilV family protein n=1 Tax=Rhodobacterales TaxID=204455 RepID=UPI000DEA8EE2|nr:MULTISPECIES: type II secretion system protein [Rhodobacterales]MDO6591939.1 type II secretion system protein [Yoonia sp. 1_MG-2023]RBW45654.1 hypothetical protein DS901_02505 [Loktanella sp. D2R18]